MLHSDGISQGSARRSSVAKATVGANRWSTVAATRERSCRPAMVEASLRVD